MASVRLKVLKRDAFTCGGRGVRIPGKKRLKDVNWNGLCTSQAAGCEGLLQFCRTPVSVIVQVLNYWLNRVVSGSIGLMPVEIAPP